MCVNPKYNIKALLRKMPGQITRNKYLVCIELEITETTWDNWCNTERGAKFSIPSDAFLKLTTIFNCQTTDLINGKEAK